MEKIILGMADEKYKKFQCGLIPGVDPETVIGVRVPQLRKLAVKIHSDGSFKDFVSQLPHRYYDENILHALVINEVKDYSQVISLLDEFLPHVDNWAVCDALKPLPFKDNRGEAIEYVRGLLSSEHTYTVRFGINMLMVHFLDEDFDESIPEMAAAVDSDQYYIRMGAAWFFATALAKQWERTVKYIEDERLDTWTHNKAIQKCVESRRIPAERKEYLKSLKKK